MKYVEDSLSLWLAVLELDCDIGVVGRLDRCNIMPTRETLILS